MSVGDYAAGLVVGAVMATILVNQAVNAEMWEASENICKENGGVLEVVADVFSFVAHCSNGVSKEFSIK